MSEGLDQQMYFIVHLQNNKSTKSQSTDIFLFVLEGVYANFISQLQQTVPQTNKGKGQERNGRGYNRTFIKPVSLLAHWNMLLQRNLKET